MITLVVGRSFGVRYIPKPIGRIPITVGTTTKAFTMLWQVRCKTGLYLVKQDDLDINHRSSTYPWIRATLYASFWYCLERLLYKIRVGGLDLRMVHGDVVKESY